MTRSGDFELQSEQELAEADAVHPLTGERLVRLYEHPVALEFTHQQAQDRVLRSRQEAPVKPDRPPEAA